LGKLPLTFSRIPINRQLVIRVLLKEYLRFDDLVSCSVPKLYAYASENPVSNADPLGLATLVMVGGPSGLNVLGHDAIAFSGLGVYSYGTTEQFGSSTTAYLTKQASYRDTTAYLLNTTPEQEQAMANYLNHNYLNTKYHAATHNCATAVNGALMSTGIGTDLALSIIQDGGVPFFQLPGTSSFIALTGPNVQIIQIPKGGQLPAFVQGFDPR